MKASNAEMPSRSSLDGLSSYSRAEAKDDGQCCSAVPASWATPEGLESSVCSTPPNPFQWSISIALKP